MNMSSLAARLHTVLYSASVYRSSTAVVCGVAALIPCLSSRRSDCKATSQALPCVVHPGGHSRGFRRLFPTRRATCVYHPTSTPPWLAM